MDETDKNCAVLLTDAQEIKVIRCEPDTDTFDAARKAIGCEWIEIVEPKSLARDNLVLLIDEEAKLKGNGFVNCVASHLYGSEQHGDVIVGGAVIVKANGESLELLTGNEAKQITGNMMKIRGMAIESIAKAFQLQPKPKRQNEMQDMIKSVDSVEHTRRQPCKKKETER